MEEKRFCAGCGHELEEGASFCTYCGREADNTYGSSQESQYGEETTKDSQTQVSKENSNNVLTLVFGILAIAMGGYLWAILALVFSGKADKDDTKTKVGKVLAILGLVIWIPLSILLFAAQVSQFSGL